MKYQKEYFSLSREEEEEDLHNLDMMEGLESGKTLEILNES